MEIEIFSIFYLEILKYEWFGLFVIYIEQNLTKF